MLLFSLVTGVFWGTWFSLSRAIGALTPATFLEVGHTMIGNLGGPMSVLMPAAPPVGARRGCVFFPSRTDRQFRLRCVRIRLVVGRDDHHADGERSDRSSDPGMDDNDVAGRLERDSRPVGGLSRPPYSHFPHSAGVTLRQHVVEYGEACLTYPRPQTEPRTSSSAARRSSSQVDRRVALPRSGNLVSQHRWSRSRSADSGCAGGCDYHDGAAVRTGVP